MRSEALRSQRTAPASVSECQQRCQQKCFATNRTPQIDPIARSMRAIGYFVGAFQQYNLTYGSIQSFKAGQRSSRSPFEQKASTHLPIRPTEPPQIAHDGSRLGAAFMSEDRHGISNVQARVGVKVAPAESTQAALRLWQTDRHRRLRAGSRR